MRLCGLNDEKESQLIKTFGGKVAGMRSFGSAVLEMTAVASGQLDAFIGKDAKIWDIAANVLFIREAGGVVATVSGKKDLASLTKDEFIIACSLTLFPKFQKALTKGE